MSAVGVFLGGEGRNELGSRAGEADRQSDDIPGVLQTLLRRVQPDGWQVVGATQWKNIRKLNAKGPTPREERNVLGLVYEANRASAQAVAFVRDGDDEPERAKVIQAAIVRARQDYPSVEVIGGVAIPLLEAWILAMMGEHKTERLSRSAAQAKLLTKKDMHPKDTAAMVEEAQTFDIGAVPRDATGLRQWLADAGEILPRLVREARGQ